MTTTMLADRPQVLLGAPETRRFLNDFVKRRVNQGDVDDVVQTVLCDALQSTRIPDTETEMRRWLTGIARHKIADLHRKATREQPSEIGDIETAPAPVEERMMAEWAEEKAQNTKDAERTLRWMAREGEGEKLEQIAAEEQIEAATVRQRVSRMRRWMKEQWVAELAAACALVTVGFFVWQWLRADQPRVVPEPNGPVERAYELRRAALESCKRSEYQPCIEGLDRARDLDPAGDGSPEVREAREGARKALDEERQAPVQNGPPTKSDLDGQQKNELNNGPEPLENLEAPSSFPVPSTTGYPRKPSIDDGSKASPKAPNNPKTSTPTGPVPTTNGTPFDQKTSKPSAKSPPSFESGEINAPSNASPQQQLSPDAFPQQQAVPAPPQQQQAPTSSGTPGKKSSSGKK